MKHANILSIDVGSSSIRGSIVNSELEVLGTWSIAMAPNHPAPNFVEYDGNAIRSAALQIIELACTFGPTISGISITNQRATTVVWDATTSKPVGPVLSWMDLRTAAMCLGLAANGLSVAPNQSATKVAFLASLDSPDNLDNLRFGTLDTYLVWVLTNGKSHVTDHTNAAMTGFIQDASLTWDPRVLDALGLPPTILPSIVASQSYFGEVNHRGTILPILGLIGDQQASMVGQGCFAVGDTKITFGTGTILDRNVGQVPPSETRRHPNGTFPVVAYSDSNTITWANEAIGLGSGSMLNWLFGMGILTSIHQANQVDSNFRSHSRLYAVPANTGLGTPEWDFGARSLYHGIDLSTTKADFVAATLDSIAQLGSDLIQASEKDTGVVAEFIHADGGMTANSAFMQMVADATGIEIRRARTPEASTLGAAVLAFRQLDSNIDSIWKSEVKVTGTTYTPRVPRESKQWLLRREAWSEIKALSLASVPEYSAVKF